MTTYELCKQLKERGKLERHMLDVFLANERITQSEYEELIGGDDPSVLTRTWTPLSIKRACGNKWTAVKEALMSVDIYEDFVMAQELREDDEAFQKGITWAKNTYGEEAVEAVLSAASAML